MKTERILSYKMSQSLSKEEVQSVSAGMQWTNYMTANGSYSTGSGWDATVDVTMDF